MKACHAEWARQRALKSGVHNYLGFFFFFLECAVALKAVSLPQLARSFFSSLLTGWRRRLTPWFTAISGFTKARGSSSVSHHCTVLRRSWSCREQFFQEFRMSSQHKVELPLPHTYLAINVGLFLLLVIVTNTATLVVLSLIDHRSHPKS